MKEESSTGLQITVSATIRQRLPLAFFERVVTETLRRQKVKQAGINVVFVGEKRMRTLNEAHRGKRGPTNVLAYPYEDKNGILGDVIVCVPYAAREAKTRKRSTKNHLAALVIHGTLHLTGMMHDLDADAERMEAAERAIARRIGIEL